ncbi:M-phase inducer phosphatase [Wickerhamiella sorbophila]|uniref:M-phase inducer phosphatase n=1 Tax=Wickerhamiella sorbophila TaxID=45607 RepID=A0A2T0FMD6_9ASCO|nr:M-phase inducer phosphatase [Wickerhamiella sorbophila]PRT56151.1 M-phase inducer phosphatase [Wickerhamiella sorbophila]
MEIFSEYPQDHTPVDRRGPLGIMDRPVFSPLDSSPGFFPTGARLFQPLPREPNASTSGLSATDLAADMSENFHIGNRSKVITPRRTLFPVNNNKMSSKLAGRSHTLMEPPSSFFDKENAVPLCLAATTSTPLHSSAESTGPQFKLPTKKAGELKSLKAPTRQIMSTPSLPAYDTSGGISSYDGSSLEDTFDKHSFLSGEDMKPATTLRSTFERALAASTGCPPAKVRRTQSMFQSTEQFLSQQMSPSSPVPLPPLINSSSVEDELSEEATSILGQPGCEIETFTVKQDQFRRIKRETLCELLDGKYKHIYGRVLVIDCRFEYEYEGGHIAGAINISSKTRLLQELLSDVQRIKGGSNEQTLLVFHCEYSAYRGPLMASRLRQLDREINLIHYPKLHYPDIVILDGGYSQFYQLHHTRCEPQNYVGMNDDIHRKVCERELDRFRDTMRLRKSPVLRCNEGSPGKPFKFPGLDHSTPCRRK